MKWFMVHSRAPGLGRECAVGRLATPKEKLRSLMAENRYLMRITHSLLQPTKPQARSLLLSACMYNARRLHHSVRQAKLLLPHSALSLATHQFAGAHCVHKRAPLPCV
jgi:hypothetical protein